MDPVESVRAGFTRELCRSLEEAGTVGGAGGVQSGGGGAASLRFMAYLSLVATEVRGHGQNEFVPAVPYCRRFILDLRYGEHSVRKRGDMRTVYVAGLWCIFRTH